MTSQLGSIRLGNSSCPLKGGQRQDELLSAWEDESRRIKTNGNDGSPGLLDNAGRPRLASRKASAAWFRLSRATKDLRVVNPALTRSFLRDLRCPHVGFGSQWLPQLKTRHLWGGFRRDVWRDFSFGGVA